MGLGALVSVALGILSVMILFSLAASALQEAIAQLLNTRGKRLRDGIVVLLQKNFPEEVDPKRSLDFFYNEFYEAAELKTLTTMTPVSKLLQYWDRFKTTLRGGNKKLPSAIEPRRYAEAVFKLLESKTDRNALAMEAKSVVEKSEEELLDLLRSASEAFGGHDSSKAGAKIEEVSDDIQATITRAQSMVEGRLQELEDEFNQTMDRVSGWYARQAKMTLFLIGLFLAIGANIDLIDYTNRLVSDENLRNKAKIYAQLLAESEIPQRDGEAPEKTDDGASSAPDNGNQAVTPEDLRGLVSELDKLEVRIGWCEPIPQSPAHGAAKAAGGLCPDGEQLRWPPSGSQVIGWILIAIGVSLGAEFWFTLLKKFLGFRTSGKVRETTAGTPRSSE